MRLRLTSLLLVAALCGLPLSPLRADQPSDRATLIANLRAHVKHVFVIYQENRSFDSYFGSFPGAENLTTPLAQAHGFKQYDAIGNQWIEPYRIADPDLSDADHSRPALIAKADGGRMDLFVGTEEFGALARGYSREDAQRIGLLTMGYQDCDTIPFLWKYAHSFALFDHFFQATTGPSTPGNISIIAAQTGQTQWAHDATQQTAPNDKGPGVPVVNDTEPAFGPYPGGRPSVVQDDLTFANVLLTLSGKNATNAKRDDDDIKDDVAALAKMGRPAIPWGWYQEGFTPHPQDTDSAYVTHHNAVQYFGYMRKNAYFWNGVHDLSDLLPAIREGKLGASGVVFVKGGYANALGEHPANPSPNVQQHFMGDDDHPGYSDSQISESMVATVVNAIARSKYWNDSAILITWDDSEGFYDHVPPPQFERCPDGHPCGDGPRVPAILISPYAKTGAIVSDVSDHASFVKFLGTLFNLPALASLPDEAPYMPEGPRDTNPMLSDLTGAFDPERLAGTKPPLPASLAQIPDAVVRAIPTSMNCTTLGITPAIVPGLAQPPPGYAPRLTQH